MGEGLQHQDGHSLLLASTVPFCQAYDPAFAYEVAAIVKNGLNRMYGDAPEDIFYYITLYNENYRMPARPASPVIEAEIVQGLYKWQEATGGKHRATILFSGAAQGAARAAAVELLEKYDVGIDLWSATSYKTLREEALEVERWNRLHPTDMPRQPLVTRLLSDTPNPFSPIVAVTDFMRAVPEQVARFIPGRSFTPLGTDGMGRSDTREALRQHFEVDMPHVVVTVLHQLALAGTIKSEVVQSAITAYAINPEGISPLYS
jgi:pyruvate dehydrogenase E1 component